jgi:hypothetical protein
MTRDARVYFCLFVETHLSFVLLLLSHSHELSFTHDPLFDFSLACMLQIQSPW